MLHLLPGVVPSVPAHDRSSTQHDAPEPPGTDDSFGDVGGAPATSAFRASGSVIPRALPNSPRRGFLALRARRSVGVMSARAGVLPRRRRARHDRFTPEPAVPLGRHRSVWEAAVRPRLLPGRHCRSGEQPAKVAGRVRFRAEQPSRRLVSFGCLPTHQTIEPAGPVFHALRATEGSGWRCPTCPWSSQSRSRRRATVLPVRPIRVTPSGTLLLVGHRQVGPATGATTPAAGQVQVSTKTAVAALDPHRWEVVVAKDRPRASAGIGVDAVIRARRLS